MAATTPVSTAALPATCPVCGYVFGLLDAASISAHFLAHLVTSYQPSKSTADW